MSMQATSALERNGCSALRPGRFTLGKDSVPIVNEIGWTSRLVWAEKESLASPEFDPRTTQPAANRYTHYAIQLVPVARRNRRQEKLHGSSTLCALTKY